MPGLKVGSIDVQVEDDRLIVAAERNRAEWPQETQVHIAEREYSPIKRAFRLPPNTRRDGIRAAYTDGVLELTVEKRTESNLLRFKSIRGGRAGRITAAARYFSLRRGSSVAMQSQFASP
jgi:HSP20 family molecular chaperone IbpA